MHRLNLLGATLLLAAWIIPPAIAQSMSGEQVKQTVTGSTFTRTNNNQRFWSYYKGDRTAHLKSDRGLTDKGAWRVTPEGEFCVKWTTVRQGQEGCWKNLRVESRILRMDGVAGMPDNAAEMLPGNPQGF